MSVSNALTILDKLQGLLSAKTNSFNYILMFFDSLSLPAWIKDSVGNLVCVNKEYKKNYPVEIISDSEVNLKLPNYVLGQYAVNDLWVINYKRGRIFIENAPKTNDPDRKITVFKFPIFNELSELCGTAGIELPPLPRE